MSIVKNYENDYDVSCINKCQIYADRQMEEVYEWVRSGMRVKAEVYFAEGSKRKLGKAFEELLEYSILEVESRLPSQNN